MCLRPPATAPASAPVIATAAAAAPATPTDAAAPAPVISATTATATTTAAGRRGRATVPPARVARPLARGPVVAAGRLTPLGLARPRLFGRPVRVVGVVRPGSHIGPIRAIRMIWMVRMVGPVAYVGPIRTIGPRAHRERRRAHRKGARVRARHEVQGIAGPRSDATRVHIGAEPIFEIQTGADAGPQAVHEQVVRLVVEAGAARVVDVRAIHEGPPVAETEPAEEERIVERAVVRAAIERVVEERIVAGAEVAGAVRPAPAEAHVVRRRVVVAVGPLHRDDVRHGIVVEMTVGHALRDVDERGFLVVTGLAYVEHAVVPVIPAHEGVELERRGRAGCQHHARALALVQVERLAIAAAAHLDRLAAAHEGVVARIDWEQHPHPAV